MTTNQLTARQVRLLAKAFTITDRANERQRKGQPLNDDTLLVVLNSLMDVTLEWLPADDLDKIECLMRQMEAKATR